MVKSTASAADKADPWENQSNESPSNDNRGFRVVGIAMVVDQHGHAARLVVRYPTVSSIADNIFFRLPSRQMAKLFRPKPALCGQPMTLSVGGTIFCCCAKLLADDDSDNLVEITEADKDKVALFSVVVALAPQSQTAPMISTSDDLYENMPHLANSSTSSVYVRRVHVSLARLCRVLEREERRCRYVSIQANLFDLIRHDLSSSQSSNNKKSFSWQASEEETKDEEEKTQFGDHPSAKSTAQTIPIKPLLRRSASLSGAGDAMGTNKNSSGDESFRTNNNSSTPSSASATTTPPLPPIPTSAQVISAATLSPASFVSNKSAVTLSRHRHSGSRGNFTVSFEPDTPINNSSVTGQKPSATNAVSSNVASSTGMPQKKMPVSEERRRLENLEQEILETMMAAPPTSYNVFNNETSIAIEHQGNLARELIQVFHALARNDHNFPKTPDDLLSGGEGVVYINRHIAVAIEALTALDNHRLNNSGPQILRTYQTLLFPTASPSQILESMMAVTCSRTVGRIQQFLRTVNPQKSLADISVDASLPISVTMELAEYLVVGQGVCIASPVVTRSSRFACHQITKIKENALEFSQTFGTAINLFRLVSFLTEPGRTFGEAMILFANSNNDEIVQVRESLGVALLAFSQIQQSGHSQMYATGTTMDETYENEALNAIPPLQELEDLLFQIVVYLCSRGVLVQLQDYIVSKVSQEDLKATNTNQECETSERKCDSYVTMDKLSDDLVFSEMDECGCLSGKVSVTACSWKIGIEAFKILELVSRNSHLQIVTRIPCVGDDWGAV
jgi:hypothetical protein